MVTPPFHEKNTDFAYQLHYHVGFATRRRVPVLRSSRRCDALRAALDAICDQGHYHLLELEIEDRWVRMLLSLRPAHAPAKVVQTIKANLSRRLHLEFPEFEKEMGGRALWSRAYYVRSVGDVTDQTVHHYIGKQRQHHAGNARHLAAYQHPDPGTFFDLRPFSHCVAEYNCHLVCCPVGHVEAIDVAFAPGLVEYLLRVADARRFTVLSLAILDDHLHLFAALAPSQSPQDLAFAVMNNTSHWFGKHNPGVFKVWDVPGFWTSSAFVRTTGVVTTNIVRAHLLAIGADGCGGDDG